MRKIFPDFVYTRAFGCVMLLVVTWLEYQALQLFHGFALVVATVLNTGAMAWLSFHLADFSRPFLDDPAPAPARKIKLDLHRAYLVLHINIRQDPPVVTFAHVYSASARDLTNIGGEAHADLYSLTGTSYHEAHEELMQVVPLYFPWIVPLMTRSR